MRRFVAFFLCLFPPGIYCQNEISLTTSTGVNGGYSGYLLQMKNLVFTDYNGQEIGRASSLETYYGSTVGCRAQSGIEWKNLRVGFQFKFSKVFFLKRRFKTTPQIFSSNNMVTSYSAEFNFFSYSTYLAYKFHVLKKLNIVPQV